ncbi:MAG: ATP-binding cassette domain-containing protein [Myxococcales bacterium]|nr:ATP-binding cassette domain-containing protein [Myxococcales bacterium]
MASAATTSAASAEPAVDVRGLVKRYGEREALCGLDLLVPRGSFFGLLGPNGAGKTTTIGVLTTLVQPTAGTARLFGWDVQADRGLVRAAVGVVFQEASLDPELTAREQLDLYARLYHIEARRSRVEEILALVGLGADADRPTRQFSGGMKRRLEIGRGLLHRPRVLFLDEPTLGLDVAARARIWEHLRALHAAGDTTIFLTTHSMEEADALCEQLAIVDGGRVVAAGAPDALKAALGGDVVRIALERPDSARERLARVEGVREVAQEPGTAFRVTVQDGPRRLAGLIECVRSCGVLEVTLHRPSLEHVFLHHTGARFEARDA